MRVVIFGDDRDQVEFDALVLRQAGLQPVSTINEGRFFSICAEESPDLVIIDITSEEMDLLSLVSKVRAESVVPIVAISPQREEGYVLQALDRGVDDYLIKPHTPRMLSARVRTLLRRTRPIPLSALGPLTIQDLTLDSEQRLVVSPDGSTIRLTNLEFRLLFLLMRNAERVVPSETIVERVWGYGGEGDATLVKNLVSRLRRKVEPDPANPRYIKTVPGIGYSFAPGEEGDPG